MANTTTEIHAAKERKPVKLPAPSSDFYDIAQWLNDSEKKLVKTFGLANIAATVCSIA